MNPTYDSLYQRAAELAAAIVSAAGAAGIRTIFAGGSLGTGDVASQCVDERLEIFSDIDLYVVVADEQDKGRVARVVHEVLTRGIAGAAGIVFGAATDAGVYTTKELCALAPRPGTVALGKKHAHLYGDETLYAALDSAFAAPMDPTEGLYLIENRIAGLAMLNAPQNESDARYRLYCIRKLILDVGAGHLIARGQFEAMRPRQRAALGDLPDGEALSPRDLALMDASGSGTPSESLAITFALSVWRRNARRLLQSNDTWVDTICVRAGRGSPVRNFRDFVSMRTSLGQKKLRAIGEGLAHAGLNARDACRLAPLAHHVTKIHGADLRPFDKYLHQLTQTLAYPGDTVLEQALRLYRSTH